MKSIIDNFSERAKSYSKFRPVYPKNLYDCIYSHVKNFDSAWDCGTGNGQVAAELANKFNKVHATDISNSQLALAHLKPNIFYSNSRSEETQFANKSFDLVTAAQAIHWFDLNAFFTEAKRVMNDNAILAIWGYNLLKINQDIDNIINHLYYDIVGNYWNAERQIVADSYQTIQMPFKEIVTPVFEIETEWNYEQLIGYLGSWSAVNKFQKLNKTNPIDLIGPKLLEVWGDKETYIVKFPLFLRVGKTKK